MDEKVPIIHNVVYSLHETASVLGVSVPTVKRMIKRGVLKASRPSGGRRVLIYGDSILEMLDRSAP